MNTTCFYYICCINICRLYAGLEKSTRPLVFTSASGCRASETLDDFQRKLTFFPYMPIIFVMQGKCLFQDISRPDMSTLVVPISCLSL